MNELIPLMMMGKQYDFIIVGGGITGSICAYGLADLGYNVLIFEKQKDNGRKPGETISKECESLLKILCGDISFENSSISNYTNSLVAWGDKQKAVENNKYNGFVLDRKKFDKYLIDQVCFKNIEVKYEAVTDFELQNSVWKINSTHSGGESIYLSKYLIIATGRKIPKISQLQERVYFDKLIGIRSFINNRDLLPSKCMMLESFDLGWLYGNTLPCGLQFVYLFTDYDLLDKSRINEYFNKTIKHSVIFNSIKAGIKDIDIFDARTYWTNYFSCGNFYITLGDSLFSIDPLSGQGIYKNLLLVDFFLNNLQGFVKNNTRLLKEYEKYAFSLFAEYNEMRLIEYSGNPYNKKFWNRRERQ